LKVRLSKMGEQDNTIMAGEGGLQRQETQTRVMGQDRRVGTERRGETGKSRKYRAAKKYVEIAILHNMIK